MEDDSTQRLFGGTMSIVLRVENTIHRTSGPWTPQVHRLLDYLHGQGIVEVPEPLGFDATGMEVLTCLPGTAAITLTDDLRDDQVLVQAARLLRRMHDATVGIASRWLNGWQCPPREPVEVICHGDFAPYNCLFEENRLTGVIDFDNARPAPRLWDISYAVYRFAPLTAPSNPEHFGNITDQSRRARMFCDAYGLEDRSSLMDAVIERVFEMAVMLRDGAANGDARFKANIDAGHLAIYEADFSHLQTHKDEYRRLLEK